MRRVLLKREHLKELGFELQAPLADTREQCWEKRFGQKILVATFQTRKVHVYYDMSISGLNVVDYSHKVSKWIKFLDEFIPIYEYAKAHPTLDTEDLGEEPDIAIENAYLSNKFIDRIKDLLQ